MGMGGGSSRSRVALSEINVTPLVDVMLVLLIIFMVTAPLMQQGLDVELPETADSGQQAHSEPTVLVIRKDRTLHLGSDQILYRDLRTQLKAKLTAQKNKQIYLQADKAVAYGYVAEIMAEIRAAGIFNIGLVTVPKSR